VWPVIAVAPGFSIDSVCLTKIGRGLIAARMINAATILIVRRRRSLAVRAVGCV
jgi:hypothetical protein